MRRIGWLLVLLLLAPALLSGSASRRAAAHEFGSETRLLAEHPRCAADSDGRLPAPRGDCACCILCGSTTGDAWLDVAPVVGAVVTLVVGPSSSPSSPAAARDPLGWATSWSSRAPPSPSRHKFAL